MYWDFGSVVLEPQRASSPLDWQSLLAPSQEILAEIGFGNGEHLEYLASKYPNALVVGIEVSQWCLSKAARRALQGHFKNLRLTINCSVASNKRCAYTSCFAVSQPKTNQSLASNSVC